MRYISVLVVDQAQENKGILVNAGFVLGLTAGRSLPDETFGPDVVDGDGNTHRRLTNIGHYVRKAGQSKMRTLRRELSALSDVTIVDYTEDAAPADYSAYQTSIAGRKSEELNYRALHIYGPEELVLPRTKNLSSLT